MLIGVDFDNTLIDYAAVFAPTAVDMGLLPQGFVGDKAAVRAALRAGPAGEKGWMRLQGQVYGRLIGRARPFPGARAFLAARRAAGDRLVVVSHKTEFGHFDPDRVDLRAAARNWLTENGFFDAEITGLSPERAYFEPTRDAKIARIAALGCDVFIDDLPEVLSDPAFPATTAARLFAPDATEGGDGLIRFASWEDAARAFPP